MIMDITETATMRATSGKPGTRASTPARGVTLRVESPNCGMVPEPVTHDSSDNHADKELVRKLAGSALYLDYQHAFSETTGLPLALRSVEDWQLAHASDRHQNAFCALVARQNRSCAGCLEMQQQVCNTANGVPGTLKCSFGINETAVTVKLGDRTIGYLQTGQVLFKKPTASQTAGAVNRLKDMGAGVNGKEAAATYQATRVIPRPTYDSMVRLLEFFAKQLSLLANQILLQDRVAEPPQVARARQFIHDHCEDELSLSEVARHAAISPFYLCKKFKEVTGLNFTDYVSRVRVEKARQLLSDPNQRVSEIAYQTGFQSLSHFNRCFKRITGQSPTACRAELQTV
jgi:AraC-like DNA-binding protein/ligand-binding sensor protein